MTDESNDTTGADLFAPGYRYHATKPRVVVLTERDEAALGKGWYDSPKKAEKGHKVKE